MLNSYFKKTLLLSLIIIIFFTLTSCSRDSLDFYKLRITTDGQGTVSKSPDQDNYLEGTEVNITADAEEGYKFEKWTSTKNNLEEINFDVNSNTIIFIVQEDMELTANFTPSISAAGNINVRHNFPQAKEDTTSLALNTQKPAESLSLSTSNFESAKENELIIRFNGSLTEETLHKLTELGYKIKDKISILNLVLVEKPGALSQSTELKSSPDLDIRYIEPNYVVKSTTIIKPNDEYYGEQWHLPMIRMPQAWAEITSSSQVRVSVIDTGIDWNHPDLKNIDNENGYNFVEDNDNAMDKNGHGTHVAGILGAATDNNQGIAGTSWAVEILPVKALADDGQGSLWDVGKGILYSAGLLEEVTNPEPVDIITLSLGASIDENDDSYIYLQDVVIETDNAGVIMVASAGNTSSASLLYPAAYPEVISVGAVTFDFTNYPYRPKYSNYSNDLDLVAPGGGEDYKIFSTYLSDEYVFMSGTSMAAPQVSGVIALMLANNIPPYEVRDILHQTSMSLTGSDFDPEYGYGLLNGYWAVNNLEEMQVIVGRRSGDEINKTAAVSLALKGGEYEINEFPAGEYRIMAWIDTDKDQLLSPGDYFKESELIDFQVGQPVNYDLTVEEWTE